MPATQENRLRVAMTTGYILQHKELIFVRQPKTKISPFTYFLSLSLYFLLMVRILQDYCYTLQETPSSLRPHTDLLISPLTIGTPHTDSIISAYLDKECNIISMGVAYFIDSHIPLIACMTPCIGELTEPINRLRPH